MFNDAKEITKHLKRTTSNKEECIKACDEQSINLHQNTVKLSEKIHHTTTDIDNLLKKIQAIEEVTTSMYSNIQQLAAQWIFEDTEDEEELPSLDSENSSKFAETQNV